ncbi:MAG: hypothetical protein IKU81_09125 [Oscillibacter sp.]|nr:hypothetical protein [Oscillibacter sp.]
MKKRSWLAPLLVVVMIFGAMNMTVSVAAEPGSDQDPLVTLSYLNDTFLKTVLEKVDQKIAARNTEIVKQLGGQASGAESANTFSVVTLTQGQILTGDIGCEVMLRVGTAACVSPSAPGLIDETSAGTLNNGGALEKNHLYMMTIEGRGVQATAATTKLLVRGTYTVA